jgi:Spy/CpxP family protein refolding chaperone
MPGKIENPSRRYKMKQTITLLALAALCVMVAAPVALARGGMEEHHQKMMEALGLSSDQQKQVEKAKMSMMEKILPIKNQLDIKRAELKALWSMANPDKKALLAKETEMDGLRQQIREVRVDFRLGMLKILSAEQKTKFQTMAGHFAGGRDMERGEEHEGGGCPMMQGMHGAGMGGCPMMQGKEGTCDCQMHGEGMGHGPK